MSLLFMGSNTSFRAQNLIFTVQIVATRVSNLSSKFQLDLTTNEARSIIWWNLGNEMCFSFFFSLLSVFLFSSISFCFCFCFFIITNLGSKNMGPIPSHTREPNTNSIIHDTPIWMIIRIYLVKTLLRKPNEKNLTKYCFSPVPSSSPSRLLYLGSLIIDIHLLLTSLSLHGSLILSFPILLFYLSLDANSCLVTHFIYVILTRQ